MAKPPLVDHLGREIDFAALRREHGAPTVSGVRTNRTSHPADGLEPDRLAMILRSAEAGDAVRYLELAEQLEEKYPHYLGVMTQRKNAVAQLELTVEPADDSAEAAAIAKTVEDWLDRDELQDELLDILDAVGKGYSLVNIVWETSAKQWMPKQLIHRPAQFFKFDPVDDRTPMLIGDDGIPEHLAPYTFVFHEHRAKSGIPIRGGLARVVAWAWLFQAYAWKDWMAFAEVYGLPLRVGRYDNGETPANIRLLMNAVASVSSDAAAVFPKSMDMEFIDGKGSNGDGSLYQNLCVYSDDQVSKVVVGQTATTDAKIGGLGSGKEHGEVRADLRDSDAVRLAATINAQLVKPIVDFNHGPQAKYPRVRLGVAESVDVTVLAGALAPLIDRGLKVGQKEVLGKIGMTAPAKGEDVLTPMSQGAPPAGSDPETPPKDAPGPRGGPVTPTEGSKAARDALKGLKTDVEPEEKATAALGDLDGDDAIDGLVAASLDGWEEMMAPIVGPIERLVAGATSLTDIRDRLAAALQDIDPTQLGTMLATAGLNARLAGVTALPLTDDQETEA